MPEIEISKFKARRGTDQQRLLLVFDQGELIYTTDTKRLFSGDGVSLGGVSLGNKIHPPLLNYNSLTALNAQVGDIVAVDGTYYELLSSNYANLNSWEVRRTSVDPIVFTYDSENTLYLNQSALSASYLDPNSVSNGVKIESGILQSNFNAKSLEISAYQLSLKVSGIDEREISSTTFYRGISGGSETKVGLNVNPDIFYFVGDQLNLSGGNPFTLVFSDLSAEWFSDGLVYNTTTGTISTTVTDVDNVTLQRNVVTGVISIDTDIFGSGLYYNTGDASLSATLTNVDGVSLERNSLGVISIANDAISGTNELAKITVDVYGRVTNQTSSIYGTLTGNSTLSSFNVSNTLSAIFNGTPAHSLSGAIPGLQITQFTALSSNGSVITLSSAGFITFEGGMQTRNGQMVGRFAIPIFTY